MKLLLAAGFGTALLTFGIAAPASAAQCAQPFKPAGIADKPIVYTPPVKAGHASGTVMLRMYISPDGKVTNHEFIQHSGSQALDIAAMRDAMKVQYTPEIVNCKPVSSSYLFVVEYPPENP